MGVISEIGLQGPSKFIELWLITAAHIPTSVTLKTGAFDTFWHPIYLLRSHPTLHVQKCFSYQSNGEISHFHIFVCTIFLNRLIVYRVMDAIHMKLCDAQTLKWNKCIEKMWKMMEGIMHFAYSLLPLSDVIHHERNISCARTHKIHVTQIYL